MAKYDITCSCGHTETVQIYGKAAEREKEIARREKGICKDCWKAAQAESAKETAQVFGLVQLEGSEKQIAWANDIRAKVFDKYGAQMQADKSEKTQAFMSFLMAQSSAKYWIDRQDATIRGLAQEWMKGEGK
ncbi:hypothetical protein [uncultured Selenomonas sp.]|uniref:hypothetical protein n=1 Tax=uncultured Selenomonas sp. TaxID=159275 RepID=UPI0028D1F005|nr:hypothetical protein [uncultured Selenomonas sp.]